MSPGVEDQTDANVRISARETKILLDQASALVEKLREQVRVLNSLIDQVLGGPTHE